MAKRMLADVLWTAANVYLTPPEGSLDGYGLWWSCNAVLRAEVGPRYCHEYSIGDVDALRDASKAVRFLIELGVDPHATHAFHDLTDTQGSRYMWLLLAMHVAEDEVIEL